MEKTEELETKLERMRKPHSMKTEITEEEIAQGSKEGKNLKVQPENQPLLSDSNEKPRNIQLSKNLSMGFMKKRQPPSELKETFNIIIHMLIVILSELGAGPIEF